MICKNITIWFAYESLILCYAVLWLGVINICSIIFILKGFFSKIFLGTFMVRYG